MAMVSGHKVNDVATQTQQLKFKILFYHSQIELAYSELGLAHA